jgi:hypothetical protein
MNELADRFAIQDLVYNYTHALDGRDEALFRTLWDPDAVWDFLGDGGLGTLEGSDAILAAFRKTAASGRQMHHCSTNLVIHFENGRATGRSKSVTTGFAAPLFVSYYDDFVRAAGTWRFQRREVRAHVPQVAYPEPRQGGNKPLTVDTTDNSAHVASRLAIQELVFNYNHALDTRNEALFEWLWATDAGWHFPEWSASLGLGRMNGIEAILNSFRASAASGRQTHHCTTNLVVTIDGDRAAGHSKAFTSGRGRPSLAGYEDSYVLVGGTWKFQLRQVTPYLHGELANNQ